MSDAPHAREHALEVELPFLQARIGTLPTTPLLFGEAAAEAVADAIDLVWSDDTLLVVSSDLSHFEAYASARAHDARTAAASRRSRSARSALPMPAATWPSAVR